jgi:hypothetical protein
MIPYRSLFWKQRADWEEVTVTSKALTVCSAVKSLWNPLPQKFVRILGGGGCQAKECGACLSAVKSRYRLDSLDIGFVEKA